jgi:apolipoprotein D and lipocalin family protein
MQRIRGRRAGEMQCMPTRTEASTPRCGARSLPALCLWLCACSSYPPLPTVDSVDLEHFMGRWYVVAHIPASSEQEAHNAIESYRLESDGTIATTYAFRDGGFEAPFEVMEPSAVVRDTKSNATWGMRFVWPFRFEYLITWLDPDYQTTIIARSARDYAWIMARQPDLPEARLQQLIAELASQGYDVGAVRRVPHRWPDPQHPLGPAPDGSAGK